MLASFFGPPYFDSYIIERNPNIFGLIGSNMQKNCALFSKAFNTYFYINFPFMFKIVTVSWKHIYRAPKKSALFLFFLMLDYYSELKFHL